MPIPDPALILLVGPSGSGKSTWAVSRYRESEIVSSDGLRAVVGSGEHDLDASNDALELLDQIVAARTRRGLTTVVDTLGFEPGRRRRLLDGARTHGLPAVAVLFGTDATECRRRNRLRDRPVPAAVLTAQLRRMQAVIEEIAGEGWNSVLREAEATDIEPGHSPGISQAQTKQRLEPAELSFVLQISRFPWGDEPAAWLSAITSAAVAAGFDGLALMDHLIQIPQVGRAWEPIPEPWVTLGLLAGLGTDLRLGTLVSPVTFRPAGVLAKTVATLDALTGGRAFCGIGAGWWDREHAAFGLPFPSNRDRLHELEATIETLRALWRPGTKAHTGSRISLPETTCYPRPSASLPIIVGGGGEHRTLRIAAQLADGCNVPSDIATLDRKVAILRKHCTDVGRDPEEVAVTVLDVPVIGTSRDEVAAIVERLRGNTAAATFAKRHHAGTQADHIGRYRLLAERGVSTVFVSLPDLAGADEVLRFAPIAAAFS